MLEDLDREPAGTTIVEVDELLRACGYTCYDYQETLVYDHQEWGLLTFSRYQHSIPTSRLKGIVAMLRARL